MSRDTVFVRDATPADAAALQSIWLDFAAEHERSHRDHASLEQIERSVLRLETDPSERLVVATVAGEAVGVAHLRRAPVSPLHEDDAVHVGYLHVLSGFRRRGVGCRLLEAAADWADEKDAKHVVASVAAAARDANRFLARLGLGQVAVVRASTVTNLRSKLGGSVAGPKSRTVATNIVAARRLRRRSRSRVQA
jgi:GNAT superfamily N-acetyltransferase